jgi:hypothetical protein
LCRGNGAEVANTQFCSHLGISAGTTFNSFCLSQRVVNILRDLAPRNNCLLFCWVWTNYLDFDCVVDSQAYHLCAVYRNSRWFSIVYFIQILTFVTIKYL